MVTPSDGWDDTPIGYQNGESAVTVRGVIVQQGAHATLVQTAPPDHEHEVGGYEVCIRDRDYSPRSMACFADARQAWEFANLLTHYIDRRGCSLAIAELTPDSTPGARELDKWDPPTVIEDMEAVEALERVAGSYSFVVDEIRAETRLSEGTA